MEGEVKVWREKDMAPNNDMNTMLTTREVAELLHVHINTVRRWSDSGVIRAYRISPRGDRRFKREDIELLLSTLYHNTGNLKPQSSDEVGQFHIFKNESLG